MDHYTAGYGIVNLSLLFANRLADFQDILIHKMYEVDAHIVKVWGQSAKFWQNARPLNTEVG